MKITYVTGNKMKILTAKKFLEPLGIEVDCIKLPNCPEIQADTTEEVAKFSSRWASEELKQSVLKNDSALVIPALNNFPGPYTKYVEETITEDGILNLMRDISDRYAYWIEVLAYTEYNGKTVTFTSITKGSIATKKDGDYGWGYDHIFIPEGKTSVFSTFDDDTRVKFFDDSAYVKLAEYLKEKKVRSDKSEK